MKQGSGHGPLVLLADSQLLFSERDNSWFFTAMKSRATSSDQFAVYIGASNGNEPQFYEMAKEALLGFGVNTTLSLKHSLNELGAYLDQTPSVILLAGGDVALGWQFLNQPLTRQWIDRCYQQGTLLLGISAGAIQLTHGVFVDQEKPSLFEGYGYLPVVTMVHEENENWPSEKLLIKATAGNKHCQDLVGVKIPFGGGIWVDANSIVIFGRSKSEISKDIKHYQITSNIRY